MPTAVANPPQRMPRRGAPPSTDAAALPEHACGRSGGTARRKWGRGSRRGKLGRASTNTAHALASMGPHMAECAVLSAAASRALRRRRVAPNLYTMRTAPLPAFQPLSDPVPPARGRRLFPGVGPAPGMLWPPAAVLCFGLCAVAPTRPGQRIGRIVARAAVPYAPIPLAAFAPRSTLLPPLRDTGARQAASCRTLFAACNIRDTPQRPADDAAPTCPLPLPRRAATPAESGIWLRGGAPASPRPQARAPCAAPGAVMRPALPFGPALAPPASIIHPSPHSGPN